MSKSFHPRFVSAGRFISRGRGKHETRIIDSWELIFVLSGTLEIFEEEKSFAVSAGERLFLAPGKRHGGIAPYGKDLSFFWLHFTAEDFRMKDPYGKLRDEDYFREYAFLLLSEQRRLKTAPHSRENLDSLTEILLRESENLSSGEHVSGYSPRLADETDRFIRLHFDEEVTTSAIAKELNCNPDYLSRLYTKIRKCTIGDSLRRARIAKACALLENSAICIKQTAYESGYNDVSYFRRQFLRECGIPPGAYRKLRRGMHVNTQ